MMLSVSHRADGRFETATVGIGKIEPPAIGTEHVLDDGKAETGAVTALVEAGAAFKHAPTLLRWNSLAVVFDEDCWSCGRNAADDDTCSGVPRGIFQQVAEDFGEVGAVKGNLDVFVNT